MITSLTVMQEDSKRLTGLLRGITAMPLPKWDTKLIKAERCGTDEVDVGYLVNKKNKIFIRRLSVEGKYKTRDNVILREMRLLEATAICTEGPNCAEVRKRLNRLLRAYQQRGHGTCAHSKTRMRSILKVKVKKSNTGALMGGIGYSTYYDVGVTASRNGKKPFWPRGYWLQLQDSFSWRRNNWRKLSFTNPRVHESDTDLSVGNDLLHYTHDYWGRLHLKDTLGRYNQGCLSSWRIYTTLGLAYRLERYELYA